MFEATPNERMRPTHQPVSKFAQICRLSDGRLMRGVRLLGVPHHMNNKTLALGLMLFALCSPVGAMAGTCDMLASPVDDARTKLRRAANETNLEDAKDLARRSCRRSWGQVFQCSNASNIAIFEDQTVACETTKPYAVVRTARLTDVGSSTDAKYLPG